MWGKFYTFKTTPKRGVFCRFVQDTDGVTAIDIYRATGPYPNPVGFPIATEMFETKAEAEAWAFAQVKSLLSSKRLLDECYTWDHCPALGEYPA